MANQNNVLMLVENYYPSDIRVRREAEALVENGYNVTVIALKRDGQKAHEVIKNIVVYRIPELSILNMPLGDTYPSIFKLFNRIRPILKYLIEYAYFTVYCFIKSMQILPKNKFNIIHLHNPPDTLFVVAGFFKLFGKKVVFDHHDLSPELFSVRFKKEGGTIKRILILLEGFSCRLADALICTNTSYKEIDMERHGIRENKIFIVRNNPRLMVSNPNTSSQNPNNQTILYIGSINPQDGVDLLIEAIEKLVHQFKMNKVRCIIVGDGDALPYVKEVAVKRKIGAFVDFYGYIFDRSLIYKLLDEAVICVEPAPNNEANRHSTFIKLMEYMAAGKPIVAFDLKESRRTAEGAAVFVKNDDIEGFALAIKNLLEDEAQRMVLGDIGQKKIASELNWAAASRNLLKAYASVA
jgi:glycosyltransferase involved in cell wall biosynthesis